MFKLRANRARNQYTGMMKSDIGDISEYDVLKIVKDMKEYNIPILEMMRDCRHIMGARGTTIRDFKNILILLQEILKSLPKEDRLAHLMKSRIIDRIFAYCKSGAREDAFLAFLKWMWNDRVDMGLSDVFEQIELYDSSDCIKCIRFLVEVAGVEVARGLILFQASLDFMDLETFKLICPANTKFTQEEKRELFEYSENPALFDYIIENFLIDFEIYPDNIVEYLACKKIAELKRKDKRKKTPAGEESKEDRFDGPELE